MDHRCESGLCARRDLLKAGAVGLTWGLFGLSLPNKLFLENAYGITPDASTQRYDAVLQIFYNGGPSQTDTWDPKPGSPNNVFPTLSLGSNDIYGNPIHLSNVFSNLANLVTSNPSHFGLGMIRSMYHGNGAHGPAESFMNCFWQSPVANIYPSTAAVFSVYSNGQSPIGIPSVVILGNNGVQPNDSKGANISTALGVPAPGGGQSPIVQALSLPPNTDANRYARIKGVTNVVDNLYAANHPDNDVKAWLAAWKQAHDVTLQGKAAKAFDLTNVTTLPGGTMLAPDGSTVGTNQNELKALTLAQQLLLNGVPYVAVGIGGNDTHTNNMKGVTMNWANITDTALSQMAKNIQATGKRVLVVMGGEFGRTPNTTAPVNGQSRDGRDHHPVGFSWSLFSINQPRFKTNAVGDTGPDGMYTTTTKPALADMIYPGVLGALVYRSMGYDIGTNASLNIPIATGSTSPPVDSTMATSPARGNATWLMQQFGIN